MLSSGCATLCYVLYAQLFLQPQVVPYKEHVLSELWKFHGLSAYLSENTVSLNMNPRYGKQDVIHNLTPRVLHRDIVLPDKSHL